METLNHDKIAYMLGELTSKVDNGFSSINQRLDVSNGRLSKHDEKIASLTSYQDKQSGEMKVWAIVISFVVSTAGVVAGLIFKR